MDYTSDDFRVVVVDDDPSVLSVTCQMLERILCDFWPDRPKPIPIVHTTDAWHGKGLIEQTSNGVLVTDIDLASSLNGFDLAEAAPHLPVIMITGALEQHLNRIRSLGRQRRQNAHCGLQYLGKPYRLNEMAETLRFLME